MRLMMLAALLVAASSSRADHDTAETVLSAWLRLSPRMHLLQPARKVRDLPATANKAAAERAAQDARSFLNGSLAVLLVENGEILFEGYANGASKESPLRSYSMAKSLTALAVGEALCAGRIKSLEDKAAVYVPDLEGTAYGAATIRQLLMYASGAQDPGGDGFTGIHNPGDFRAMVQHQLSLLDLMKKYGKPSRFRPGEKFVYNGLDSAALSLVVRAATGVSLPKWFEDTVWQKAGGEHPAGWYLDKDGNGIGEILVLATARDFARVGLYVLERLNGKTDDSCGVGFVRDAASPHINKGYWNSAPSWGLGLHVGADGNTWMFGHGAQRIGVNAKMGRVFAANGFKQWQGYDGYAQGILSR
jgi:CubicO group peptidase (beta-lactamase class C family)